MTAWQTLKTTSGWTTQENVNLDNFRWQRVAIPAFLDIPIPTVKMTEEKTAQRHVLNSTCQPTNALLHHSRQSLGNEDS